MIGDSVSTFIDRFSDNSDVYANARPVYPEALFDELSAKVEAGALAWDCGCGNGQAAVALSARFQRVYASDASAQQIANALPRENVEYHVGSAEACSLPDAAVDLIVVAQALHWFDLERFYAQARRVLKPTGGLAVVGYDWFYISPEIDAIVAEDILRPLEAHWAPNNRLLWDGYRSIDFPLHEERLSPFAIHLEWRERDLFRYVSTWSSTRAAIAQRGSAFLEKVEARLSQAWGDPAMLRHVVMPLHTRFGRFRQS